jgi:hypothetical protein
LDPGKLEKTTRLSFHPKAGRYLSSFLGGQGPPSPCGVEDREIPQAEGSLLRRWFLAIPTSQGMEKRERIYR